MISIILVNYHSEEELYECLQSIKATSIKTSYEILVVDNDEDKVIKTSLLKKFPEIIYIPNDNKGFGQANNVAAKKALGEYLFFLNPDTLIYKNTVDSLVAFLKKHPKAGIAAPLLYYENNSPIAFQGLQTLTPLRGIIALSFINKFFPRNKISQDYWNKDWDKKTIKSVGSVPGTAFMIRREIFKKIEGFDEHFFLYFEEVDLCKRVLDGGWKIYMCPEAKAYHKWGRSTQKSKKDIQKIFNESRFYYFKKHFGTASAIIVELFTRMSKNSALIWLLLLCAFILRIYRLPDLMSFIGDQGWFYLSARDIDLGKSLPLLGITSSHTWLHQGPFWTYILAVILPLNHFNPLSPGYVTATIDTFGVFAIYKLGSEMFSRRFGIIAALLYAFSPLVIFNARMPFHTSLIPILMIFYIFSMYKWIKGNSSFFPLIILLLAVLYNFELATFTYVYIFFIFFLFGTLKKKKHMYGLLDKKNVILSLFAFILPMAPMLLYDVTHRFPQTIGFLTWNVYKLVSVLGLVHVHDLNLLSWHDMLLFCETSFIYFIAPFSSFTSLLIFFASIIIFSLHVVIKKLYVHKNVALLFVINLVGIGGLFLSRTTSGAYLPMLLPGLILFIAYTFNYLFERKLSYIALFLLLLLALLNSYTMFSTNYFLYNHKSKYFTALLETSKLVVRASDRKPYTIKWEGSGGQFSSFTDNYAYLTWWLGHGPSLQQVHIEFVLLPDKNGTVSVIKKTI